MTKEIHMTRTELLEAAAADALGMLDEFEAECFNRSFHEAPPAVQEEIQQLQAEIAADNSLLPNVTPPETLRERVLEHLRKRILEESSELAPLATIGRFGGSSVSINDSGSANRRRSLISHDAWRAAAIVLVGVVVAISIFAYGAYERANALVDVALNLRTQDQLELYIGSDFDAFVANPSCVQVALYSADDDQRGMGHLWINQRDDEVFILALDLPAGDGEFSLNAVLADGTELSNLASFEARPVTGKRFSMNARQLQDATFMVTDASGNVVLTSSPETMAVAYASPPRVDHSAS